MRASTRDAVDEIVDQWKRLRPELDLQAMAIFGRLGRLGAVGGRLVAAVLERHQLQIGEFDVLAALRRAGPPHRLTPTQMARAMMLSSGAMTNRLDRLEKARLIERLDDPNDRRGILVTLTPAGLARIDAAVADHVANESKLLGGLTKTERAQLATLLRKLLLSLERE